MIGFSSSRIGKRGSLLACLAWVFGLTFTAWAGDDPVQVGSAEIDITAPRDQRMAGYFHDRHNTGTKDPLKARALVFKQGKEAFTLVTTDLIGMRREITERVRARVNAELDLDPRAVAITATHTHTAPVLEGAYVQTLEDRLVSVIKQAHQNLKPATLTHASGPQDPTISFNRRFHMKSGPVRFNPGVKNPDIVRVAGPIDPQVSTLWVTPEGETRSSSALTGFTMHLDTVGGTEYSADYPYFLEQALRQELGDRFISLFGTGTCGDINHVDVSGATARKTAEMGQLLARTALGLKEQARPVARPNLGVAQSVFLAPLQSADPSSIRGTPQDVEAITTPDKDFLTTVTKYKFDKLTKLHADSAEYPVEVQAVRLGDDLALVLLPGEVFVELGLAIKTGSPFAHTILIELANDTPNYIPTARACREGSYETINSILAHGTGEKLVEVSLTLLKGLKAAAGGPD